MRRRVDLPSSSSVGSSSSIRIMITILHHRRSFHNTSTRLLLTQKQQKGKGWSLGGGGGKRPDPEAASKSTVTTGKVHHQQQHEQLQLNKAEKNIIWRPKTPNSSSATVPASSTAVPSISRHDFLERYNAPFAMTQHLTSSSSSRPVLSDVEEIAMQLWLEQYDLRSTAGHEVSSFSSGPMAYLVENHTAFLMRAADGGAATRAKLPQGPGTPPVFHWIPSGGAPVSSQQQQHDLLLSIVWRTLHQLLRERGMLVPYVSIPLLNSVLPEEGKRLLTDLGYCSSPGSSGGGRNKQQPSSSHLALERYLESHTDLFHVDATYFLDNVYTKANEKQKVVKGCPFDRHLRRYINMRLYDSERFRIVYPLFVMEVAMVSALNLMLDFGKPGGSGVPASDSSASNNHHNDQGLKHYIDELTRRGVSKSEFKFSMINYLKKRTDCLGRGVFGAKSIVRSLVNECRVQQMQVGKTEFGYCPFSWVALAGYVVEERMMRMSWPSSSSSALPPSSSLDESDPEGASTSPRQEEEDGQFSSRSNNYNLMRKQEGEMRRRKRRRDELEMHIRRLVKAMEEELEEHPTRVGELMSDPILWRQYVIPISGHNNKK